MTEYEIRQLVKKCFTIDLYVHWAEAISKQHDFVIESEKKTIYTNHLIHVHSRSLPMQYHSPIKLHVLYIQSRLREHIDGWIHAATVIITPISVAIEYLYYVKKLSD